MTQTLSVREDGYQRRRTDFEDVLGEHMRTLLWGDDTFDVSVRPNGKVIVVNSQGRHTDPNIRYSVDESEALARAILQTVPRVPELNERTPSADCKVSLSDDAHFVRVHIDSDVLTHGGYNVSLRKQQKLPKTLADWVADGQMRKECLDVMDWTIRARRNVLFCGKMMSGKTTFRNGHFRRMAELDPTRALVEVMDVDETACPLDSYVPLFYDATTSAAQLCRSFVRTSSDAVGVNELRGSEAYDLVHDFWISGHNGSSSTMHVETPEECGWRLKTLIAQSGHLPQMEVIAKAVHLLVFFRFAPGVGRRVTRMCEITGVSSSGDLQFEDLVDPMPFASDEDSTRYRRRSA